MGEEEGRKKMNHSLTEVLILATFTVFVITFFILVFYNWRIDP